MAERPLSPKQRKFVELFDGNATEAARKAGYAGTDEVLAVMGSKLVSLGKVARAIKNRESREIRPQVAERIDRQRFWTDTMWNPKVDWNNRLRASELLGRSEGDFLERVEVNVIDQLSDRLKEARARREREGWYARPAPNGSTPKNN